MKIINICYVDDLIDIMLSRFLHEYCEKINSDDSTEYELKSDEYTFNSTDNYKTLLANPLVNSANILIIDSRLFENEKSELSKFTGEQFKIILKQVLPFIKTIVISQNEPTPISQTVAKYKSVSGLQNRNLSQEYYEHNLEPIIKECIVSTLEEISVLEQLDEENEVDPLLLATIHSTISGIHDTALFEKEDLDKLIELFNEVKISYGD